MSLLDFLWPSFFSSRYDKCPSPLFLVSKALKSMNFLQVAFQIEITQHALYCRHLDLLPTLNPGIGIPRIFGCSGLVLG